MDNSKPSSNKLDSKLSASLEDLIKSKKKPIKKPVKTNASKQPTKNESLRITIKNENAIKKQTNAKKLLSVKKSFKKNKGSAPLVKDFNRNTSEKRSMKVILP